ncbi:hypothetical protein NC652_012394 [Populus alba x Populus x berolinensis]|nr:hypothetical protein NC652_012394 [Populus alba x Populus x berolinensis]
MESVFLCLSGLHISEAEGDDPFGESRQIACKNGCGNFHLIGGIPRNQNPKQDWCQLITVSSRIGHSKWEDGLQKISSSKKMEMDGLSQSSQPFLFGLLQKGITALTQYQQGDPVQDKEAKAVLAGEVDNYSSGTSNESPISLRPEMVKEWRDGGSSCGNKRKKKGEEAMVESSIFLTSSPPSSLIAGNPTSNKSNASKNGSSGHSTPLDYFPFYLRLSHGDAFNTQNANFSNSDNRECFSHSKPKIKAMFIASGSLSFSARPLFPSLGDLRKSLKPKGATKTIDNKKNKQDDSQLCSPNQMKPIGPFPEAILLKEFCEGEERQDMEIHMIGACEG